MHILLLDHSLMSQWHMCHCPKKRICMAARHKTGINLKKSAVEVLFLTIFDFFFYNKRPFLKIRRNCVVYFSFENFPVSSLTIYIRNLGTRTECLNSGCFTLFIFILVLGFKISTTESKHWIFVHIWARNLLCLGQYINFKEHLNFSSVKHCWCSDIPN